MTDPLRSETGRHRGTPADRSDPVTLRWEGKRAWHAQQRSLPLQAKIRIVLELQRRQQTINEMKRALGLPVVPMRVWDTEP